MLMTVKKTGRWDVCHPRGVPGWQDLTVHPDWSILGAVCQLNPSVSRVRRHSQE